MEIAIVCRHGANKKKLVGATMGQQADFELRMLCGINCLQLQCNSPRLHHNIRQ
jgi:hypothetical protein